MDKFTLSESYGLELPFKSAPTAIVVGNLTLRSRNGRVGRLKVGELETAKDKVLNLIASQAENVQTMSGLQNWLTSSGAVLIANDLFWIKSETQIHPLSAKKQTAEKKAEKKLFKA